MSPEIRKLLDLEVAERRRKFQADILERRRRASDHARRQIEQFFLDGGSNPGRFRIFEQTHQEILLIAVAAFTEWPKEVWDALLETIDRTGSERPAEAYLQPLLDQHIDLDELGKLTRKLADPDHLKGELDRHFERYGLSGCLSETHFHRRFQLALKKGQLEIRHAESSARQRLELGIERFISTTTSSSTPSEYESPHSPKAPVTEIRAEACIPKAPKHGDPWVSVIRAAVKEFIREHKRCPERDEMWDRLQVTPPTGYTVKTDNIADEFLLFMPGEEKTLGRQAFRKRWARYTAE